MKNSKVSLHVGGKNPYSENVDREPRFLSIDQNPGGSYTFRLELQEDGHDDSSNRNFDWWFEWLTKAAAAKQTEARNVTIQENWDDDQAFYQISYVGRLSTDSAAAPRLCRVNSSLFEFDLEAVEVTRTWTLASAMRDLTQRKE